LKVPKGSTPGASSASARESRIARGVRDFLREVGADLSDPELKETPQRVARAWLTELLDGYQQDPSEVLGKRMTVQKRSAREMVVMTGLRFHSVCPHHLLPWEGVAHIAYMPDQVVVGFGRLSSLLDCLGHRLVLQEALAQQVAAALFKLLPSRGAACVLEGSHDCLRLRGARQRNARSFTEAYEGAVRRDRQLRKELWTHIERFAP
jgi:GTP cyclohydrolase I